MTKLIGSYAWMYCLGVRYPMKYATPTRYLSAVVYYWVSTKYNVDIIGVDIEAINITEDREQFRKLMKSIDIDVAPAKIATSFLEGKAIAQELGFPLVIRPSFTLGGSGASFVHTKDEFEDLLSKGLHASPIHEVLIDKAVLGWKEYELELLRDDNDNVIIICNIEIFTQSCFGQVSKISTEFRK